MSIDLEKREFITEMSRTETQKPIPHWKQNKWRWAVYAGLVMLGATIVNAATMSEYSSLFNVMGHDIINSYVDIFNDGYYFPVAEWVETMIGVFITGLVACLYCVIIFSIFMYYDVYSERASQRYENRKEFFAGTFLIVIMSVMMGALSACSVLSKDTDDVKFSVSMIACVLMIMAPLMIEYGYVMRNIKDAILQYLAAFFIPLVLIAIVAFGIWLTKFGGFLMIIGIAIAGPLLYGAYSLLGFLKR